MKQCFLPSLFSLPLLALSPPLYPLSLLIAIACSPPPCFQALESERQRSAEAVRALNLSLQEQSSKCGLLEGGKREAEEKLKAEKVRGRGRGLDGGGRGRGGAASVAPEGGKREVEEKLKAEKVWEGAGSSTACGGVGEGRRGAAAVWAVRVGQEGRKGGIKGPQSVDLMRLGQEEGAAGGRGWGVGDPLPGFMTSGLSVHIRTPPDPLPPAFCAPHFLCRRLGCA